MNGGQLLMDPQPACGMEVLHTPFFSAVHCRRRRLFVNARHFDISMHACKSSAVVGGGQRLVRPRGGGGAGNLACRTRACMRVTAVATDGGRSAVISDDVMSC